MSDGKREPTDAQLAVLERLIALETTLVHVQSAIDKNAERESNHWHTARGDIATLNARTQTLEERHDVRFRQLEQKVFMGMGMLAAFQFIVGTILAVMMFFKK